MSFMAASLTHAVAWERGINSFFFSHVVFDNMRKRGNTHFCFYCGGQWGFKPDRKGRPANCEDPEATLKAPDGHFITVREVIQEDSPFGMIPVNVPYYTRRRTAPEYEKWLASDAYFSFGPKLVEIAAEKGCTVVRSSPMRNHDPKTHRNAMIGGANKFKLAADWLKATLPHRKNFPYVVNII